MIWSRPDSASGGVVPGPRLTSSASTGGSAILWSTAWACCWPSWSRPRTSTTRGRRTELFARLEGQVMGTVIRIYADCKYHNIELFE